jgi:PAS domain S-box-containing protein
MKNIIQTMLVSDLREEGKSCKPLILTVLILIALLAGANLWIDRMITVEAESSSARNLSTITNTTHQALHTWLDKEKTTVETWSSSHRLLLYIKELLDTDQSSEFLLASPVQTYIRKFLDPALSLGEYQGFYVVSAQQTIIAADRDDHVGQPIGAIGQQKLLEDINQGVSFVGQPTIFSPFSGKSEGSNSSGEPTMFVGAPIKNSSGEIVATLVCRINPLADYARILQKARSGLSGETYVFDKNARLLSNSKHEDALRELNLLTPEQQSIFNIRLYRLEQRFSSNQEEHKTRMAEIATSGHNGVDIDGYENYLGNKVVGAWMWDKEMQIGIATEVNIAEEFRQLRMSRIALAGFAALSAFLLIALTSRFVIAERKLISGRQRFYDFSSSTSDWLWETDAELKYTYLSVKVEEIYNLSREKLLGRSYLELNGLTQHKALPTLLQQHIQNIEARKPFRDVEIKPMYVNGKKLYLMISGIPVFNAKGEFTGYRGTGSEITERIKFEQELMQYRHALEHMVDIRTRKVQELEERSRQLLNAAGQGIFGLDTNGNTIFVNPMAEELLGYSSEELTGRNMHELIHHSLSDGTPISRSDCKMHCSIQAGTSYSSDNEVFWRRDESPIPVSYVSTPITKDNQVVGSVVVFSDITERLAAEEALKILSRAVECSPLSIVITDREGNIEHVNPHFTELTGYSAEEARGQNPRILKAGKLPEKVYSEMWHTISSGRTWTGELHNKTKDGVEFWERCSIAPIFNNNDEISHYVAVKEDITQSKEAQKNLIESQERLLEAQKLSHVGNWDQDLESNISLWSDEAYRIFGFEPQEFKPSIKHFLNAIHPQEIAEVRATLSNLADRREPFELSHRIIRPNGDIRYVVEACRVDYDQQGKAKRLHGTIRDITDRKITEQALLTAKQGAEEANKAKSEFLANMSHEIRTPMNGVIGMSDLLLKTDLSKEQRSHMALLKDSAEALLTIINNILDFSKIEAGKVELERVDFDLRTVAENITNLLAVKTKSEQLELLCHINPNVPTSLTGDPGRLRQILTNLVGNALRFTSHGEIVLRVECLDSEETSAQQKFSVQDSGIGIPKEKLEHIFESFAQADSSTTRKYGGTGLGLTISRELVSLMGGELRVESTVGKGTTFSFETRLDLCQKSIVEEQQAKTIPKDLNLKVLIVDDHQTNLVIAREICSSWGFQTQETDKGRKATEMLERAVAYAEPFDLVLLDYMMPEMNGLQVAEEIRNNITLCNTKIIVLTSSIDQNIQRRFKQIGVDDFLAKPLCMSTLMDSIATLFDGVQKVDKAKSPKNESPANCPQLAVLLAEDNPINQKVALSMLEARNYRVTLAENGTQAVEKYRNNLFDLILMDVQMPEMNGLEATRAIRLLEKGQQRVPIIALTANALKGDRENCLEAGMDDYLSKPVREHELYLKIDTLVNPVVEPAAVAEPVFDKDNEDLAEQVFNQEAAMEIVSQNQELFTVIADMFLDSIKDELNTLKSFSTGSDLKALKEVTHKLKGSFGNLGAERARTKAQRLMALCEEGNVQMAIRGCRELEMETEQFSCTLKKAIGH